MRRLPANCPVKVEGLNSSDLRFTDRNGQWQRVPVDQLRRNSLILWFGYDWLAANYPRWSPAQFEGHGRERRLLKAAEIIGFDQMAVSRDLIEDCCAKGQIP